jgi:uncharacterized RDD family membrane protein YckC
MFSALDFSYFVSGSTSLYQVKSIANEDYLRLRPLFYSTLPPVDFIATSVDSWKGRTEDLEDKTQAEYWLAKSYSYLESFGGVDKKSSKLMKDALLECLGCAMTNRERAQLWYCLRSLGKRPIDPKNVLGIVFEYGQGKEILYVSPDKYAFLVTPTGFYRWRPFEEGDAMETVQALISSVLEISDKFVKHTDNVEAPLENELVLSLITSGGIKSTRYYENHLGIKGVSSVFDLAHNLKLDLLDSAVREESSNVSEEELDSSLPFGQKVPINYLNPPAAYPSSFSRSGAFLFDIVFYLCVVSLIAMGLKGHLVSWGYFGIFVALPVIYLCLPLSSAWMESSKDWGYQTIGKKLFGMRVYSSETSSYTFFLQALARNLFKYTLSPLFFGSGFLWSFFHKYRRTWHDVVAGTVVLSVVPKITPIVVKELSLGKTTPH